MSAAQEGAKGSSIGEADIDLLKKMDPLKGAYVLYSLTYPPRALSAARGESGNPMSWLCTIFPPHDRGYFAA
jgi:hypothetical protein